MSSLSRRACFKCGNVGHYAGKPAGPTGRDGRCRGTLSGATIARWRSQQRLLRRAPSGCKQPGHESNGCPHPRTTETKQCYHCQGLGHVQADCPTLRLSGAGTSGRCYSCGLTGHLARNCPNPGMGRGAGGPPRGGYGGGFRGGFAGGARPATCYKCGGPNHFARDCQAQAMKCYACGKLGHISRDCTAPNGGPLNTAGKTCYRCGETGHISRDCTQAEVNGDGGAPIPAAVAAAPVQPVAPTTAVA
ncbi:gig suppressor [Neodidymelliopsis sp. IMI 364377]|nr:gig suppressor [Neodidymelliopsis sp. IMI 364377]